MWFKFFFTYSGYENKEKLEQTIKNRALEDYIFEVHVPTQTVMNLIKKTKKTKAKRNFF